MATSSRFESSAGVMAALTVASRVLGLIRESVFSYYFSTSELLSAFRIAFQVPNLARRLFGEGALSSAMIPVHEAKGFAFTPHNRPPIDGDITFGDTSMSLDFVSSQFSQWRLAGVDYNLVDPFQVVLFLKPA